MPAQPCCPTCRRHIEWSDEYPYRPFCSERCRLIDLGAWLSGQHAISGEPVESRADAAEGSSGGKGEE